jgi:hypothetical protein
MMESKLFIPKTRAAIEKTVVALLNGNQLMNYNTVNSPRAVGDAVQGFLESNIAKCLPRELVVKINTSFARRSMADLAFEDVAGNYYVVDIKTHNLDTSFNMPNLTSVERLARFYGDNKNYFVLLLISYKTEGEQPVFDNCIFAPIEYLDWSCLTLGALGWGQIQIANSNIVNVNAANTRKKWMLQLCDALDLFYPNEIAKITQRIDYFRNIREYWEKQPD